MRVPDELLEAERVIWDRLAPHARAAGTLTESTAGDFAILCRLEVDTAVAHGKRRGAATDAEAIVWSKEWRNLIVRLEAKRRAFRLAPMGRPMELPSQAAADPFAEFGAAAAVN